MAHCSQCGKFMLFNLHGGLCKKCQERLPEEDYDELPPILVGKPPEKKGKATENKVSSVVLRQNAPIKLEKKSQEIKPIDVKTTIEVSKPEKTAAVNQNTEIVLSAEQREVINRIEGSRDCFFITGKAGTGKSVVLRYFVAHTKKRVAVVAPTGIAAINVNGQTIHSLFKIKPALQNTLDEKQTKMTQKTKALLASIETLVIDEISMVWADVMDMIDVKMQIAKNNRVPFGGCQIVAFGDLYQLAPVKEKDPEALRFFNDRYESIYFFSAPALKRKPFIVCELNQVHRQKDTEFVNILNKMRIGECDIEMLNALNRREVLPDANQLYITLTPSRDAADRINRERLSQINSPEYTFPAVVTGEFPAKDWPTDGALRLRKGAQIMMIKNDSEEPRRWVNGTTGIITELNTNCIKVKIGFQTYAIAKEKWVNYQYAYNEEKHKLEQIEVGEFVQYPVKLAYAITIHKSQGQTYDSVMIDYSSSAAFAAGQTYVALSRCKSLSGLFLKKRLSMADIRVSHEVIDYMESNANKQCG